MKVLYINYIDFDKVTSGSSVRPYKIYQAMKELGYVVKMITGIASRKNVKERRTYLKNAWEEIKDFDFDYCYIESKTTPIFLGNNRFEYSFIKKIKNKGIPIGIFYRDVYWKFSDLFDMRGIRQFILKQFQKADMRFFKKTMDCVFLPSQEMNKYCGFKNIALVPPACEIISVEPKSKLNNTLIYVGGLSYAYGSDILIEALRLVNKTINIKLIIVCREQEFSWLKQYIVDTDYEWLTIAHSSSEGLYSYYREADFAICSHRKNIYHDFCMPVKLFEYFSYEKPVIATNCNEINNIIIPNNLGICGEDNAESLAKCIMKGYSSDFDYNTVVSNVKRYRDENTWTKRTQKIGETLL